MFGLFRPLEEYDGPSILTVGALRFVVLFSIPGRSKIFLFSTASRPALGPTQPRIQWVLGAASPEIKQEGREADNSPFI
jgi:hypothetical protein